MPQYLNFIISSYEQSSVLRYENNIVWSQEGVQQGDPIGPLLFCLVLNEFIKQIPKNDISFEVWYLDDGTLAGTKEGIEQVFKFIIDNGPDYGLVLNVGKTEICFLGLPPNTHNFSNAKIVNLNDLNLLGAAVGSNDGIAASLESKLTSLNILTTRIHDLSAHHAFFLLKNCIFIPKLLYILRSSPCFLVDSTLEKIDQSIQKHLGIILNIRLEETSWKQASLPTKFGGIGIRSTKDLALPSFLSSMFQNDRLIKQVLQTQVLEDDTFISAIIQWENITSLQIPTNSLCQKDFDIPLVKSALLKLTEENASGKEAVRLSNLGESRRGAEWLNALPSQACGLLLTNEELRCNIGLRLGLKIVESHLCSKCGTYVDERGTHSLSCKFSPGRWSRHTEANDIIQRALTSCGYCPTLEPTGLQRNDGKRPDGLTRIPWKRGLPLIWDFTCIDSFAPSRILSNISNGATLAEQKKVEKYLSIPLHIFAPVAVDTLGMWGDQSFKFLKEIGKKLNDKLDDKRAGYWMRQRLSIAVARGNYKSIVGCIPTSSGIFEFPN